jgi:hypothetical protein
MLHFLTGATFHAIVTLQEMMPRWLITTNPNPNPNPNPCHRNSAGNDAKVVDDQYMLYYFSVSMQSWRGMVELGTLMEDYPTAAKSGANATLATALLEEAVRFKKDIDAVVARSVVRNSTTNAIMFVPAAVTPGANNATPYGDMTSDTLESYSNFRYYSEMLSAGAMDEATATALMDFRENHGGTLSGMTR